MNRKKKSASRYKKALEELLDSVGRGWLDRGGLDPFETLGLVTGLEEIRDDYLKRPGRLIRGQRLILRRHVAETTRRRERRKRFPDWDEIALAGLLEEDPGAGEKTILMMLEENRLPNPTTVEAAEARYIAAYIKRADDYRKKPERKYVIEPFFRLLEKHGIQSHPKKLPRTRMMRALFNWLQIEERLRPDDEGINAIVQDMKRSQTKPVRSTRKAKPRTKRKR